MKVVLHKAKLGYEELPLDEVFFIRRLLHLRRCYLSYKGAAFPEVIYLVNRAAELEKRT